MARHGPVHMTTSGLPAAPALPSLSTFPELNVRTYVRVAAARHVILQPGSRATARRRGGTCVTQPASAPLHERRASSAHRALIRVHGEAACGVRRHIRTRSPPSQRPCGSIEYVLTERYCLYHYDRRGRPLRLEIHHRPSSLQVARAAITIDSMAAASHLALNRDPALFRFARRRDVVAWAPTRYPTAIIGACERRR